MAAVQPEVGGGGQEVQNGRPSRRRKGRGQRSVARPDTYDEERAER